MYKIFLESFMAFYARACDAVQTYSRIVQENMQASVENILASSSQKNKNDSFGYSSVLDENSQMPRKRVVYYDFPHHNGLTMDTWMKEYRDTFSLHLSDAEKYLISEPQKIYEIFHRLHESFSIMVNSYSACLKNPLFQEDHYRQYQLRHIGLQRIDGNVHHAFSFSHEEMMVYRTLELLAQFWQEEKENMLQQYRKLTEDIWVIRSFYQKLSALYPDESVDMGDILEKLEQLEWEILKSSALVREFHMSGYLPRTRSVLKNEHLAQVSKFPDIFVRKK